MFSESKNTSLVVKARSCAVKAVWRIKENPSAVSLVSTLIFVALCGIGHLLHVVFMGFFLAMAVISLIAGVVMEDMRGMHKPYYLRASRFLDELMISSGLDVDSIWRLQATYDMLQYAREVVCKRRCDVINKIDMLERNIVHADDTHNAQHHLRKRIQELRRVMEGYGEKEGLLGSLVKNREAVVAKYRERLESAAEIGRVSSDTADALVASEVERTIIQDEITERARMFLGIRDQCVAENDLMLTDEQRDVVREISASQPAKALPQTTD